MTEATNNQLGHQELSSPNGSDHAIDGAFKLQDNRVARAMNEAKSKLIDNSPARGQPVDSGRRLDQVTNTEAGYGDGPGMISTNDELEVLCGPLLNFKSISNTPSGPPKWRGSVLIVIKPGTRHPQLHLKCVNFTKTDNSARRVNGINDVGSGHESSGLALGQERRFQGMKLYADPVKAFWRFDLELLLQESEARWEYLIPRMRYASGGSSRSLSYNFVVPGASQSMRIMFHSCNGFSVGTDEDAWSGPALWNDVLRVHEQKPFHVMIGGGDQIYNDGVRVGGPLRAWTDIGNPRKRREYPFDERLRDECDLYYFNNYIKWFSTEPFASANRQIPQINVWDDHDIIDGFGSYTDHFMKCAVFRGIGGISFKYYLLMQHHVPPPKSTYTTSSPQTTTSHGLSGAGADPTQLDDTFILKEHTEDSCFIMGCNPGPYVEERSRSLYMRLGARIAFVGVDARTERTRHQVNYNDTYELIFNRLRSELSAAPEINHLIVLLGVPIAYPRLAWLENIFNSPIIGPIRFLNKRFGVAGGLFNHFDGQVDLLDDLDDHYTARQHKHERRELIHQLQALAQEYSIRITILGGDVHLAALGRFYSNPKLAIPTELDHRYMANVISSAITNKPPPKAVANLLARRNKVHHLDHNTHETLMNLFDRDPGGSSKTAASNHCTMPSRNYAIITEMGGAGTSLAANGDSSNVLANGNGDIASDAPTKERMKAKNGHSPLHEGEEGAGTAHVVASGVHTGKLRGGLDVSIRVEIDQHDWEGKTEGYGFSIPALTASSSGG